MADVKICDRCKTIFPDKGSWIDVKPERYILRFLKTKIHPLDGMAYDCVNKAIDLCPECVKELNKFLNGQGTGNVGVLPKYDPDAEREGLSYDG